MATFAEHMGVHVIRVDAEQRFLRRWPASPIRKQKRKIIGRMFIEVFERKSQKLDGREVAGAGHDLSGRDRVGRLADRQGAM